MRRYSNTKNVDTVKRDPKTGMFLKSNKIVGKRSGRLTVTKNLGCSDADGGNQRVECRCDCGSITTRLVSGIISGTTKSCGCYKREVDCNKIRALTPEQEAKRKANIPKGSAHLGWKGGRTKRTGGYILISCPGHPRAWKNRDYVAEHIIVMEAKIGRYISRSETVHHVNGQRDDNRIENLELWDRAHPSGQRHEEKMRFYMSELLKKCDRKALFKFCSEVIK